MSSMTFSQKKFNPVPPQKGKSFLLSSSIHFFSLLTSFYYSSGSFPLDHEGQCKQQMIKYMTCLNSNRDNNSACRELSKDYLACRMEHNLMAKETWDNLGFKDLENPQQTL